MFEIRRFSIGKSKKYKGFSIKFLWFKLERIWFKRKFLWRLEITNWED